MKGSLLNWSVGIVVCKESVCYECGVL